MELRIRLQYSIKNHKHENIKIIINSFTKMDMIIKVAKNQCKQICTKDNHKN